MAEAFAFNDQQKLEILRIALSTAPAGASSVVIAEEVERIAHLLSPASLVTSAISNVERKLKKVEDWKRFMGTILYIDKEIKSNRAVIILQTKPSERSPSGQELIRTGITTFDASARELANHVAQSGIGQKVLVNVAIERMDNGNKVRVVHDISFRGPDSEYNPETPVDWAALELDPAKLEGASKQFAAQTPDYA